MDPRLLVLLEEGAEDDQVEVILKLRDARAVPAGVRVVARCGPVMTGRVRRGDIVAIRADPAVASLKAPRLLGAEPALSLPGEHESWDASPGDTHRSIAGATGSGVVLGIVDWGLDVAHPNFRRDDGTTRLLALWDQSRPPSPATPEPYGYGALHLRDTIDAALRSGRPYELLEYHPASSDPLGEGSHGTHVTDIAAGNGRAPGSLIGVAPEADLIFVHLAARDTGGLATLGDTVRILEALEFIARTAGTSPWIANLSLGRCGGPHDGLTLVEQGIDGLVLEAPGRAVVMSGGNYQEAGVHARGELRPGGSRTLNWITDPADVTLNELEVWYSGRDRLRVELSDPAGGSAARVGLDEQADIVVAGRICGRAFHRASDPVNGDHHVDIFLQPSAPPGTWRVTLVAEDVVDGRFDAWVERDSMCAGCQSRFDPADAVTSGTTGTICNGFRSIAVGAYDQHDPARPLARFSSWGPTRDGRPKPDLLAGGVRVLAARSQAPGSPRDGPLLVRKSGTSTAAPQVTGTIACMFEAAGRPLSIRETRNLLLESAEPWPGGPGSDGSGNGFLNAAAAVAAARRAGHAPAGEGFVSFETDADEFAECGCPGADENQEEAAKKRIVVLVSGGPGPYDTRDVEHDASWANYVSPPLLMTDTPAKLKRFTAADEEVWWMVYRPAYNTRWTEDSGSRVAARKLAVKDVKDKGFTSYVDLIEGRAGSKGWTLHWLDKADDFWTVLGTARKRSISRMLYWGHARDDLWLTITHDPVDGSAAEPGADAIVSVAAIKATLRDRFQVGHRSRLHRFVGCNTAAFAEAWAKAYRVWAEGVKDKVHFRSIHAEGNEPCRVGSAEAVFYDPKGDEVAAEAAKTTLRRCADIPAEVEVPVLAGMAEIAQGEAWHEPMAPDGEDLDEADGAIALGQAESELALADQFLAASEGLVHERMGRGSVGDLGEPVASLLAAVQGPARLFDAMRRASAGRTTDRFIVVAGPLEVLRHALQAGDVLLRRASGEPGVAHAAVLTSGRLLPPAVAAARGFTAERGGAGRYAPVIDLTPGGHCAHDRFARRITDHAGRLPPGQMILRVNDGSPETIDPVVLRTIDELLAEVTPRLAVRVRNRLVGWDDVSGCSVELAGTGVSGTTNAAGRVRLDLTGVADGDYECVAIPAHHTSDPVGPATAGTAPRPSRIWRTLRTTVTVAAGRVTRSTHPQAVLEGGELVIRLQPVWIASPYRSRRDADITQCVIHHTAGPRIGPALNQFLSGRTSAHYVVDTDGEIVKLVSESEQSWHAGRSHWAGRNGVNGFSIGIELVHRNGEFPAAQMTALGELLRRIQQAYPALRARDFVGHSDIATCPDPASGDSDCRAASQRRLGRKRGDPGLEFNWATLEAAGFGLAIPATALATGAYGGLFGTEPEARLRDGDRDSDRRYGGTLRPAITADVVAELQRDLAAIGYFSPVDGTFGAPTRWAVRMFQERFFSGTRTRAPHPGEVDAGTARAIKVALPPPVPAPVSIGEARPVAAPVPAYGGYDLALDDRDDRRRWGGAVRTAAGGATMPATGQPGFIAQLQAHLREVGIHLASDPPSGLFDENTRQAVREFQIHAKLWNIARQAGPVPAGGRYSDTLASAPNTARYGGPVTGVVNADTRTALQTWIANQWRCPVVIEGWELRQGAPHRLVHGNLWRHSDLQDPRVRMFARDFSDHYTMPGGRNAADLQVLGEYATYGTLGGPQSRPPHHTWPEAEILPTAVLFPRPGGSGPVLAQLTGAERSTFKVIRAVSEVECEGFYDGINAYDDVFISVGHFHTPLGHVEWREGGELGAILSLFRETDPQAFDELFGFCGVRAHKAWNTDGGTLFSARGQRRFSSRTAVQVEGGGFNELPHGNNRTNWNVYHWFRSWHWFYRFAMAARTSAAFQQALWTYARVRLRELLDTPWDNRMQVTDEITGMRRLATIGDFYTSERAVALILRWHVRFPGHMVTGGEAGPRLRAAFIRSGVNLTGDPLSWHLTDEAALVHGILDEIQHQLRATTDPREVRKWRGLQGTMTNVRFWPRWAPVALNPSGGQANARRFTLDPAIGPLSMTRTRMARFPLDTAGLPPSPRPPLLWVP